ncbi:hypothetical protein C8Q75DRAFT_776368 [Abortiporus biennis]|nr:hypothetical protein C8Q75DRAFT_776368 [Abortiporus biennis]
MKRLPLVSYESSDEESDSQTPPPSKKRKLPTLSSSFLTPIPKDNPSLHQGRIRTTPHVEGQYAAYVYIPVTKSSSRFLFKFTEKVFEKAKELVPTLHPIPPPSSTNNDEFHVSLTRPIYLRAHQREMLKQAVRNIARTHKSFTASFATFSELQNDEKTRTFLTLEVGAGHLEFKRISDALIPTLRSIRQKEFYTEPRFHASIGWALLISSSSPPTKENNPCTTPTTRLVGSEENETNPPLSFDTITDTEQAEVGIDKNEDGQKEIFPAIPKFPDSLIPTLKEEFCEEMLKPIIGTFYADEVCVRIGKDVSRWKLCES